MSSDLSAKRRRSLVRMAAVAATSALLAGCGKQSTLSPHSPQTHDISVLWWWMLVAAGIVFFGAVGLLVLAWFRRGRKGLPFFGEREAAARGLVLVFGIAIPLVVLVALFAVSDVWLVKASSAPNPRSTKLTVEVIGHQWWWEIRYPGTTAVTANEIHIPVKTRVNVAVTTADVIHSFWVPELARKIDTIPGQTNRILMYASRPGVYRGQCAEFCGIQHAHMSLYVVAQPQAQFRAWLANMAAPAPQPAAVLERAGQQEFMASACSSCHQIRGTPANATVGPDLTHLASRSTIASATLANTPATLAAWIANPQRYKPGNRMPDLGLRPAAIRALVAYLETLK